MIAPNDIPERWCIICGKPLQNNQRYFCSKECNHIAIKRKTPRTQQYTKPHIVAQPKLSLTKAAELAKKHNCTYGQLMYKLYRGEINLDD